MIHSHLYQFLYSFGDQPPPSPTSTGKAPDPDSEQSTVSGRPPSVWALQWTQRDRLRDQCQGQGRCSSGVRQYRLTMLDDAGASYAGQAQKVRGAW